MSGQKSAWGRCLAPAPFLGVLLIVSAPASASDGDFFLSTGIEYSTGEYGGDSDIEDVYVPVTLAYSESRFAARITVPYAYVNAPEGSLIGSGAVVPGGGPDRSDSGIGDIITSLTYRDLVQADAFALDITGKIKFGTADEDKGLGTGESDYSLQLDGYLMQGEFLWLGTLGYKWRGDPDGYTLDDTWFAAAGLSTWLNDTNRMGAMLSYRPEVSDEGEVATDVTVFYDLDLSRTLWGGVYFLAGLTDGSPDWGIGGSLTWKL